MFPYIRKVNGEDVWFVNGRMLNSTQLIMIVNAYHIQIQMDEFINDEYILEFILMPKMLKVIKVFIVGFKSDYIYQLEDNVYGR